MFRDCLDLALDNRMSATVLLAVVDIYINFVSTFVRLHATINADSIFFCSDLCPRLALS